MIIGMKQKITTNKSPQAIGLDYHPSLYTRVKSYGYLRIRDNAYQIRVNLPSQRYCSGFMDICHMYLLYTPQTPQKTGCTDMIPRWKNGATDTMCVEKLKDNWYVVEYYEYID